jgi:hypothetical protein
MLVRQSRWSASTPSLLEIHTAFDRMRSTIQAHVERTPALILEAKALDYGVVGGIEN